MDKNVQRVFITGGAGFIGSHIARKLISLGIEPIIYDAFIQYISPFESSYQKFLEYRFTGIRDQTIIERGDTRDKNGLRKAILKYKPDVIIHLAALPIADLSFNHPEEAIGSILTGTVNILDIISETDFVKRFIYTSSSMVYGDFINIPANEDDPKSPKDIYGGTKLSGEILTQTYSRRFGMEYVIIRPSAVYGPTDVNRRVGQIFLENAINKKPLVLHGGGSNSLDFTFVEDTAEGFVLAALKSGARNEIFNITRGESRTLREFVDILSEYYPDIKVETQPQAAYRPKRGTLSIEKARKLLGYEPKFSLEDGIKRYVDFMKEIQRNNG